MWLPSNRCGRHSLRGDRAPARRHRHRPSVLPRPPGSDEEDRG
uniref:Uncharacterized protein n=1 Tax=Ciona savignyi TaxID=51511 RepID=H2YJM6_CIOSA